MHIIIYICTYVQCICIYLDAHFTDCSVAPLCHQIKCDFIGRDGYFETARIAVETVPRQDQGPTILLGKQCACIRTVCII